MKMVNWLLLVCCLTALTSLPGTQSEPYAQPLLSAPGLVQGILAQGSLPADGSSWLDNLWQTILEGLQWIWDGILSIIAGITDFLTGGLQQAVQQAWDKTIGSAEKMVNDVLQNFQNRNCMGSLLPVGVLAGMWVLYRHKHSS